MKNFEIFSAFFCLLTFFSCGDEAYVGSVTYNTYEDGTGITSSTPLKVSSVGEEVILQGGEYWLFSIAKFWTIDKAQDENGEYFEIRSVNAIVDSSNMRYLFPIPVQNEYRFFNFYNEDSPLLVDDETSSIVVGDGVTIIDSPDGDCFGLVSRL